MNRGIGYPGVSLRLGSEGGHGGMVLDDPGQTSTSARFCRMGSPGRGGGALFGSTGHVEGDISFSVSGGNAGPTVCEANGMEEMACGGAGGGGGGTFDLGILSTCGVVNVFTEMGLGGIGERPGHLLANNGGAGSSGENAKGVPPETSGASPTYELEALAAQPQQIWAGKFRLSRGYASTGPDCLTHATGMNVCTSRGEITKIPSQ